MEPYRLDNLPAIINFSGGRTSAYMLYHILEYYGGQLPDQVVVVFCNTGKENEETLSFVRECQARWSVDIHWLEYRYRAAAAGGRYDPKHIHVEVDYHTASRHGEPFDQLIEAKAMLPNVTQRFCTSYLKVKATDWFAQRTMGWQNVTNYLGIRYDEPRRIRQSLLESCKVEYLLYHAKVTKQQVSHFWRSSAFDLQLHDDKGNCDLCFMKGRNKLLNIIRASPERVDWWSNQEQKILKKANCRLRDTRNATFSKRHTYAILRDIALTQGYQTHLFDLPDDEPMACFCGE